MRARSASGILACLLFLGGCAYYGEYHPARQGYGDYYHRAPTAAYAPTYRSCAYFDTGYAPYHGPYAVPYYEAAAARCSSLAYSPYGYPLNAFLVYPRFGSDYGYYALAWRYGIGWHRRPTYRDHHEHDREQRRPVPTQAPPVTAPTPHIPSVRYVPGMAPVHMPRRVDSGKSRSRSTAKPNPASGDEHRWQTPPHRVEPRPPDFYTAPPRTPAVRGTPRSGLPPSSDLSAQTQPSRIPMHPSRHTPTRRHTGRESRTNSQNDESSRKNKD